MPKRSFIVRACWDADARIWYADSDIVGLHVEAETLPEFEDLVSEFAAELIVANHYSEEEIDRLPMKDLIPAVVIQEGKPPVAAE